jgi:hypothetical protein
MKVLLGQLGAKGDCLYATAVARQIKTDHPGCHLTWAVGSQSRCVVDGNPHVDAIWEVDLSAHANSKEAWYAFKREALRRKKAGEFDVIHFTQIYPDNYQNYDGTVRASILRGYAGPISVPVAPVVRLTDAQVAAVSEFVARHRLREFRHVVLFEFASHSGQSFVTEALAFEVARRITQGRDDTCVVMSAEHGAAQSDPRIVDGSVLGFLENAELSKYCSLLIGCSSGLSWLCTSDWARMPPTIQLLRQRTSVYASMVHDHEYHGLDTRHIVEMTDCAAGQIAQCALTALEQGIEVARERHHERIPIEFGFYGEQLDRVVRRGQWRKAWRSARVTLQRYGARPELVRTLLLVLFRRQRRHQADFRGQ